MQKRQVPNPGSDEAMDLGCVCPVLDNAHGKGYMGGVTTKEGNLVFVMRVDCKLHGTATRDKTHKK